MPRKKRLTVPGALHHVMARGIEGQDIFLDDEDRRFFLHLLTVGLTATGYHCYAWALMSNHYHFLFRASDQPLSALMRQLNSRYARYFSRKYKRKGYLFQDRFKSIATQDQGYIEELVCYIHLNPIRAGVCSTIAELDRFAWSGHAVLMGKQSCGFQRTSPVLKRFYGDPKKYQEFLKERLGRTTGETIIDQVRNSNASKENIYNHGCWVIGDKDFVARALNHDKENRLRMAEYLKTGWDLQRLKIFVLDRMKIIDDDLFARGRENSRSEARKIFAYLGHRVLGYRVIDIAKFLKISGPAVSQVLEAGKILSIAKGVDKLN